MIGWNLNAIPIENNEQMLALLNKGWEPFAANSTHVFLRQAVRLQEPSTVSVPDVPVQS